MATATTIPLITITRVLNASRERVFDAWTKPEFMNQWFAPSTQYAVTANTDLRVGGKFYVEMAHKSGSLHTAIGEYLEFDPPARVVMTWTWKEQDPLDPAAGSTVTIDLRDLGNGKTELTLIHAMIQEEGSRLGHTQGWIGALNRLAQQFDPSAEQFPIPGPKPFWQDVGSA